MIETSAVGLWPTPQRTAVSVVDGDERLHRIWINPIDESEAYDCLRRIQDYVGLDLTLIIPDSTPSLDDVVRAARALELQLRIAPRPLSYDIARCALARPTDRQLATILARWPSTTILSRALR